MKRCPLCEFIYEDEQSLCDMDGIELVHDRGALLVPAKAAAHRSLMVVKSRRRKSQALLLIGLISGAVTLTVYFAPAERAAPAVTDHTSAAVAGQPGPAPGRVHETPSVPMRAHSSAGSPVNDDQKTGTVAPRKGASPASSRPRATKLKAKKPQPERGNNKKESRLGSFFNKTGRILKKPFKL